MSRRAGLALNRKTGQSGNMQDILVIAPDPNHTGHRGCVQCAGRIAPCALGAGGAHRNKCEGDGFTPLGVFALRRVFYRADRVARPECTLEIRKISEKRGWSDDAEDPAYNRYIQLPCNYHHETLWRSDPLYDLFIELGYNDAPPQNGLGSAIFLHLQKNNFQPTRGCVAIGRDMMDHVLKHVGPESKIAIKREKNG